MSYPANQIFDINEFITQKQNWNILSCFDHFARSFTMVEWLVTWPEGYMTGVGVGWAGSHGLCLGWGQGIFYVCPGLLGSFLGTTYPPSPGSPVFIYWHTSCVYLLTNLLFLFIGIHTVSIYWHTSCFYLSTHLLCLFICTSPVSIYLTHLLCPFIGILYLNYTHITSHNTDITQYRCVLSS